MSVPFRGATARVDRARMHVDEFRQFLEDSRQIHDSLPLPTARYDAETQRQHLTMPTADLPSLDKSSIIVGETLYNLRTALDYIVYDLAQYDSRKVQRNTQFIIDDNKKQFLVRRRKHLRGLTSDHIKAIEKLQPFKGVKWTKILRDYSNPDKHRHLLPNSHEGSIQIFIMDHTDEWRQYPGGMVCKGTGVGGSDLYVYRGPLDIKFTDKTSVLETLQCLLDYVDQTVKLFQSEFLRKV